MATNITSSSDKFLPFKFIEKIDKTKHIILVDIDETLYDKDGLNENLIKYLQGKPNIYLFTKMDINSIFYTITYVLNDHYAKQPTDKFSTDKYYIRRFLYNILLQKGVNINGIITPYYINSTTPGDVYKNMLMGLDIIILNHQIENILKKNDINIGKSSEYNINSIKDKCKNYLKNLSDESTDTNLKAIINDFLHPKGNINTSVNDTNKLDNVEIECENYLKIKSDPEKMKKYNPQQLLYEFVKKITDIKNINVNDKTEYFKGNMFKATYDYFTVNEYKSSFIFIDDKDDQLQSVLNMANEIKKNPEINLDLILVKSIKDAFLDDYAKVIAPQLNETQSHDNTSKGVDKIVATIIPPLNTSKGGSRKIKNKTHKTKKYLFRKR